MSAAVLSEDESRALRETLIRFLKWSQAVDPEDLASETILRILQNLRAGVVIENLGAYARQVARHLQMEDFRQRDRQAQLINGSLDLGDENAANQEQIIVCLERCKKECLSRNDLRLIELYYRDEKAMKISNRKRLAEKLQISESALRQKVFQIRRKLGACVERCLDESTH
jgi:DNA-directed RNA polymerase specialized sigma24 family protein